MAFSSIDIPRLLLILVLTFTVGLIATTSRAEPVCHDEIVRAAEIGRGQLSATYQATFDQAGWINHLDQSVQSLLANHASDADVHAFFQRDDVLTYIGAEGEPLIDTIEQCVFKHLHGNDTTGAKEGACDQPPAFQVSTEVENVSDQLSYCMAYVTDNSPYPLTCHLNGRAVGVLPDEKHLAEGWPLLDGQECAASMRCEPDAVRMKMAKAWCQKGH